LEKIVDIVAVSDSAAEKFIQKISDWKPGETCVCLVRENIRQLAPECWEYICGIEFGFCIYLDAHTYLRNKLMIAETTLKLKAGFRLFVSATPFIGGVRDFINIARLVTQWDGDDWQAENGLGAVRRFVNKVKTGGKVSKTVTGRLASWMYAGKHAVIGSPSFLSRATYDISQIEVSSVTLENAVRLDAGGAGLDIKMSIPKWVWLYCNLSIDAGLMDSSLDLDGKMVDNDFSRTRGRLGVWGFGDVAAFCVDKLVGGGKEHEEEVIASDSEDDDLLRQVGICFVNLRV
jgi:hypothetical protein